MCRWVEELPGRSILKILRVWTSGQGEAVFKDLDLAALHLQGFGLHVEGKKRWASEAHEFFKNEISDFDLPFYFLPAQKLKRWASASQF